MQDLYQIGCIGLIKSIKRFDTNFEVKLSTYAVPYIVGEIKRFVRDDGPLKISRSIKELSYRIKIVQKEYLDKKGRELEINELVKVLKTYLTVPKKARSQSRKSVFPTPPISGRLMQKLRTYLPTSRKEIPKCSSVKLSISALKTAKMPCAAQLTL